MEILLAISQKHQLDIANLVSKKCYKLLYMQYTRLDASYLVESIFLSSQKYINVFKSAVKIQNICVRCDPFAPWTTLINLK